MGGADDPGIDWNLLMPADALDGALARLSLPSVSRCLVTRKC